MLKDKNFYNQESRRYSSKRYPEETLTYVQYFFKKRLVLVLGVLEKSFRHQSGLELLEIGCADGVVLREINKKLPETFAHLVGVDTAEDMISEAKLISYEDNIEYFVRGQETAEQKFACVLEIGVANYGDIEEELIKAHQKLKNDGLFVLSLAGRNSFNAYFGKGSGYNNFFSYQEYEKLIVKYFVVKEIIPVGLYLPIMWRCYRLARPTQKILEKLFRFWPNFYHEKIYVLKKKDNY